MGFSIHARPTEEIATDRAEAIRRAADELASGRSWLRCEPPLPFMYEGRLFCSFKPNFSPHPDDVASAEATGEPDGTLGDAIEILAQLSREQGVDWEIGMDHADGPVGFIRGGVVDDGVLDTIEALGVMYDAMAEFDPEADG